MHKAVKSTRRKNDFYPTPSWATDVLLQNVKIGGVVLEPCAGDGDIVNVLLKEPKENIENVWTNDIDVDRGGSHYNEDATKQTLYDIHDVDWIVTNPPFNCAQQILEKAHKNSLYGVAFLLRLSFLEPTYERGPFLAENPPNKVLVLPRISFTGDGKTDSVTVAWLIWDKSGENWLKVIPK